MKTLVQVCSFIPFAIRPKLNFNFKNLKTKIWYHKILVHGGWGDWTEWEECPVSCGGADQGRTRVCDNPVPEFGGDDCTVDGSSASETQRCNENPCPSTSFFLISYDPMIEIVLSK